MNKTLLYQFIALAIASSAMADDLVLSSNVTYRDYRVTQRAPDGVTITHASGITKLLFRDMPPEIRVILGYNPDSEAQYLSQQAKANHLKTEYTWASAWLKADYDRAIINYNDYANSARNPKDSKALREFWTLEASKWREESISIKERLDLLWKLMQSWDDTPYGFPRRIVLQYIKEKIIVVGMPRDLVKIIHGTPSSINTQEGDGYYQEQWVYDSKYSKSRYYYIEQGKVSTIQE